MIIKRILTEIEQLISFCWEKYIICFNFEKADKNGFSFDTGLFIQLIVSENSSPFFQNRCNKKIDQKQKKHAFL